MSGFKFLLSTSEGSDEFSIDEFEPIVVLQEYFDAGVLTCENPQPTGFCFFWETSHLPPRCDYCRTWLKDPTMGEQPIGSYRCPCDHYGEGPSGYLKGLRAGLFSVMNNIITPATTSEDEYPKPGDNK